MPEQPAICPMCSTGLPDSLDTLPDQRQRLSCTRCGHVWLHGTPVPVDHSGAGDYTTARKLFPSRADVDPARIDIVEELKAEFLASNGEPSPDVAPFWERYQRVFSADGLEDAAPADFHYFANIDTGAGVGTMTMFNNAWTAVGPEEGARRVRESVRYLLYGPDTVPLADRLTELVPSDAKLGMTGWKEALLTKTLSIVHPQEYVPIVTYTSINDGKREIAKKIWGLDLPEPAHRSIGRLIVWSNNLLVELAGTGFVHTQHLSQFLWQARNDPRLAS